MIELENYLSALQQALAAAFGSRLVYLGLQGSYLRGEAGPDSDLDVVVILDGLEVSDLDTYRSILHKLPHEEKSCGFLCGREELARWNPLEICHLLHSTRDLLGSLSQLVPAYTREDVENYCKLSLNNLYHLLCHSYVHGDPETAGVWLKEAYKGAFFILQNLHYLQTGHFPTSRADALGCLKGEDRALLETGMKLAGGEPLPEKACFQQLFDWCAGWMQKL